MGRDELERSSSFARSFFAQTASDAGGAGGAGGVDPNAYAAGAGGSGDTGYASAAAAGPGEGYAGYDENSDRAARPRMDRRQRSQRRLSRTSVATEKMPPAASASSFIEGEPTHNLPHVGDATGKVDRQTSWYTDALLQGGTEDLSAILGQVQDAAAQVEDNRADDDEVLEQYRIMAHVEANIRVTDNTGFDMAEYEKRRKMQPEKTKGDYYSGSKKPKPLLPEARIMGGGGSTTLKPEEPPLPPPRANRRFIEQRTPRVPELSAGVVVRGQAHIPEGEHTVRCLGCKSQLRINMLATLVNCPDCSTVSPASSTRR